MPRTTNIRDKDILNYKKINEPKRVCSVYAEVDIELANKFGTRLNNYHLEELESSSHSRAHQARCLLSQWSGYDLVNHFLPSHQPKRIGPQSRKAYKICSE